MYKGNNGDSTGSGTMVYLNVYDLHAANRYAHPLGMGVYHTGKRHDILNEFCRGISCESLAGGGF